MSFRRTRGSRALPFSLENLDQRVLPSAMPYYYVAPVTPPAFDAAGRGLVGNQSRISDKLLTLFNDGQASGVLDDYFSFRGQDKVLVRVTGQYIPALETPLTSLGFQTTGSAPNAHLIEGYLPIAQLPAVEQLAGFGLLGVSAIPRPQTQMGLVNSEADWVLETDRVRGDTGAGGFTGAGKRVGVISNSYDWMGTRAAIDIASGDLPMGVVVQKEGDPGDSDEGRGMMQLIYDVAPGVSMRFATANGGEASYAQQIKDLANPAIGNCDVVVDDIVYFKEPMFQHGLIAQAVDYVVGNYNVPYFGAAGNYADRGYEDATPNFVADATYGSVQDFQEGSGVDTKLRLSLSTNNGSDRTRIVLQWDDPWYTASGVDTNLDLYLFRADTGALVTKSVDNNITSQEPVEDLLFENDTGQTQFDLMIVKQTGPAPGRIRYVEFGRSLIQEHQSAGTTSVPHSSIAAAAAVAAIPWWNQTVPESFTSVGGVVTLFDPAGNKLASPVVEPGPRFAAIDGVNTASWGGDDTVDLDTNPNFYGTSAAAPHAAAIAAIMLQKNASLTPAQIYQTLENTADGSVGGAGWDDTTGYGLINAYDAIVATPYAAMNPISDGFENGLGGWWETHNTGAGRIEVTSKDGPASGLKHVVLDSDLPGQPSRNEMILHVNLAGATNAILSFQQRQYIDPDHVMSVSFVGSENSDGVAISVDGLTWHRIVSLTGANSQNHYQQFNYNLNTIAANAGITLSSNTRIKFQRYGDDGLPNEGMAFDDINVAYSNTVAGVSYIDVDEDGVLTATDIPEYGRVIYVDANNNNQLDFAGGTIVTSGQMPAPITDQRRTLYPLVVNGTGVVGDANVTINLDHTFVADLDIALIHPNGTRVVLSSDNGGAGDNYQNTTFDDEATTAITAAAAPFNGKFQPEGLLSNFDDLAQSGTWYLEITDDAQSDTGTLLNWSLDLASDSKNFANTAIPDKSTITSNLIMFGTPGTISDVEVIVNINHTYDADLDFFLVGPNGKQVELSTDNGSTNDNYVNTRFDDEAATSITLGTAPFTGRFQPEGLLSDLDGQSANGTWTLIVTDDNNFDVGTLIDWTLSLTRTFTAPGSLAIPDNNTLTSAVLVPELGGPIVDLDVTLNIDHPYVADLDVFLTSAGGQKITLTSDNGTNTDNFTNTRFDDEADHSVVNGVGPFTGRYRPETPLSLYDGDAIGGTWTLTVTDDAAQDVGSLLGWSMDFRHELTFASVNVPRSIDDLASPVTSILGVSGVTGTINDLDVQLDIDHTYNADLEVYLTAPTGQKVLLFSDVGGSSNNFNNTILDDEASKSIGSGTGPFASTYRPETPLTQFDGLNPNGIWLLTIVDDASGDDGTLNNWSITLTTGERFDISDDNGRYDIPGLPSGTITLREQLPALLKHTEPTTDFYSLTMPSTAALADLNFGSIADVKAPTVFIQQVGPDPRNISVPSIDIVFSEPVSGFELDDLVLTRNGLPVLWGSATLLTSNNVTYTLDNLNSLTLPEGDYQLTLNSTGALIIDKAKNPLTTSATETWKMDTTAPTVVSIARNDPNPTALDAVSWTVTFSENVLTPTIGNFELYGSAANGAAITGITGFGTTRVVTATTVADGDLGLRMKNSSFVNDFAGNAVAPLPFDGEAYSVNKPDIRVEAVQVNDGSAQRSRVTSVNVRFDQVVSFKHQINQAIFLTHSNNTNVTFTATVDNTTGRSIVTLTNFTGASTENGSLADGYYRLSILPLEVYNANGVLDGNGDGISGDAYFTPAGPAPGAIHRLFGDADGNRSVNALDFAMFRSVFGLSGPTMFDFNNDNQTNGVDFAQFRARFGLTLTP